jgi:hypothetical protein
MKVRIHLRAECGCQHGALRREFRRRLTSPHSATRASYLECCLNFGFVA